MVLLALFTLFHVLISLLGIATGLVVVYGFVRGLRLAGFNKIFLLTTILTSVTGFMFPFRGITPGIVLGVASLVVLALALLALQKAWTIVYIVTASLAEFLNVLVLIAQSFQKIPPLHTLAPKGNEPVVAVCQGAALLFFGLLAVVAIRKGKFVLV